MTEYYCAVTGIFHLQSGNKSFYSSRLSRNSWPKSRDFYIEQKISYLWEILFFWALVQLINLIGNGNNYPTGETSWLKCGASVIFIPRQQHHYSWSFFLASKISILRSYSAYSTNLLANFGIHTTVSLAIYF